AGNRALSGRPWQHRCRRGSAAPRHASRNRRRSRASKRLAWIVGPCRSRGRHPAVPGGGDPLMRLVLAALSRPVTIVVALVAIALCAVLAIQRMPVDIFPQVGDPAIYVAQT